ncbi:MAG: hypothetical protein JWQ11_2871, partial [Rhizobacter sp.]|nr:hypothetical protein [Rhizobacter sp.]
MSSTFAISAGRPWPLGATPDAKGVAFAVFSSEAERIELCLYDAAGLRETARLPLVAGENGMWTGHVRQLEIGALYGLRAHGRFEPSAGLRFNANKLLVDPYARAFDRPLVLRDQHLGYRFGSAEADLGFDDRDSAAFMPKCVVCPPDMAPFIGAGGTHAAVTRPDTPWADSLVYETHVRGFTLRHPAIPEAMRGRFEGMAQAAVVAWVKALGVTAIELLPVQAFASEPALLRRGLVDYWGYNTFGFFASQVDYGTAASFKALVRALHDTGIEVILDVVYNH